MKSRSHNNTGLRNTSHEENRTVVLLPFLYICSNGGRNLRWSWDSGYFYKLNLLNGTFQLPCKAQVAYTRATL